MIALNRLTTQGRGLEFYRGITSDPYNVSFECWHELQSGDTLCIVHQVEDPDFWPIPWMIGDELHLGFREGEKLAFYNTLSENWPSWPGPLGYANQRFYRGTYMGMPMNPGELTRPPELALRIQNEVPTLEIGPLEGRVCDTYNVFRNDLLVAEIEWDGCHTSSWTDPQPIESGFTSYHVQAAGVRTGGLDGSSFWTE